MKTRISITIVLLVLLIIVLVVYGKVQGPLEGSIAVKQLEDDAVAYAASRAVAEGVIPSIAGWSFVVLMSVVWVPVLFGNKKKRRKRAK